MSKRILLVDDHKIMRDGLRSLLETQMGNFVVGEADDGETAVRRARQLKPELVIMDVSMPDMNGIEATRRIVKDSPAIKVIALSMHSDKRFVEDMLRAGAMGYLLKDCAFEELENAINQVCSNTKYISPTLSYAVLDDYVRRLKREEAAPAVELSDREKLVLVRIAEGWSTKEIANRMNLSTKTVDTYRQHIMDKLNIRNVAELVKFAIREGFATLDE